jgi:deazaflavin-dependent oxidoreductase (nitroreductase family)
MSGSGGLCHVLDFSPRPVNPLQRSLQRLAKSKPGSWVFQRTLYRIDAPLLRATGGRVSLPGISTGIPVILLTTTGAKSGLARTMPVAGIPDDPLGPCDILVFGTNFAQPRTPAWALNLRAEPRCEVSWHGRSAAALAIAVTDPEERDAAWVQAARYYVGFTAYRERIQHREVSIFRLTSPTTP